MISLLCIVRIDMVTKRQKDYLKNTDKICKALAITLADKNINEITINEICSIAKINRTTFYAHYENIYDASQDIVNVFERFILEMIKKYNPENINEGEIKTVEEIEQINRTIYLPCFFSYVRDEKLFFKSILQKPEIYNFDKINKHLYEIFFEAYFKCLNIEEKTCVKLFNFYLFGAVSIINQWLENDCKESIEEVIDNIYFCISFDFTK